MRLLLKSVDGLLRGLAEPELDRPVLASRAREVGTKMAADVDPTLMAKLPLPFKQLGLSIHKDMDALADAIIEGATIQQMIGRLSDITARCTACHDMYRLGETRNATISDVRKLPQMQRRFLPAPAYPAIPTGEDGSYNEEPSTTEFHIQPGGTSWRE